VLIWCDKASLIHVVCVDQVASNNHLRHLLGVTENQPNVHLSQVSAMIRKLTRKFNDPVYDADKPQHGTKKLVKGVGVLKPGQTVLNVEDELTVSYSLLPLLRKCCRFRSSTSPFWLIQSIFKPTIFYWFWLFSNHFSEPSMLLFTYERALWISCI
jgi:hypothetical protein